MTRQIAIAPGVKASSETPYTLTHVTPAEQPEKYASDLSFFIASFSTISSLVQHSVGFHLGFQDLPFRVEQFECLFLRLAFEPR